MKTANAAAAILPHRTVPPPAGADRAVREAFMKLNENVLALAKAVSALSARIAALEKKGA